MDLRRYRTGSRTNGIHGSIDGFNHSSTITSLSCITTYTAPCKSPNHPSLLPLAKWPWPRLHYIDPRVMAIPTLLTYYSDNAHLAWWKVRGYTMRKLDGATTWFWVPYIIPEDNIVIDVGPDLSILEAIEELLRAVCFLHCQADWYL